MFCTACGTRNERSARFCVQCGVPLDQAVGSPPPAPSPKRSAVLPFIVIGAAVLVAVIVGLYSTFRSGPDVLVGEYAVAKNGRAEIKVTKVGTNYFVSMQTGGGWSRPEALVVCSDKDFAELFGSDWKSLDLVGLRAKDGPLGIFKAKKKSQARGQTFQTGYFMFFFLGGGDIYKL